MKHDQGQQSHLLIPRHAERLASSKEDALLGDALSHDFLTVAFSQGCLVSPDVWEREESSTYHSLRAAEEYV